MSGVSLRNCTRTRVSVSRQILQEIATEILPEWDISLVYVGAKRARDLNKQLRGKEYVPNVLSYKLDGASGEIFICPIEASKQAPAYGMSKNDYILYLFIHGILHINGWGHGAKMEECERTLMTRYGKAHSNRHRHRHVPGKGGRGRRAD